LTQPGHANSTHLRFVSIGWLVNMNVQIQLGPMKPGAQALLIDYSTNNSPLSNPVRPEQTDQAFSAGNCTSCVARRADRTAAMIRAQGAIG
jgi:hypothetical protein